MSSATHRRHLHGEVTSSNQDAPVGQCPDPDEVCDSWRSVEFQQWAGSGDQSKCTEWKLTLQSPGCGSKSKQTPVSVAALMRISTPGLPDEQRNEGRTVNLSNQSGHHAQNPTAGVILADSDAVEGRNQVWPNRVWPIRLWPKIKVLVA